MHIPVQCKDWLPLDTTIAELIKERTDMPEFLDLIYAEQGTCTCTYYPYMNVTIHVKIFVLIKFHVVVYFNVLLFMNRIT